MTTIDVGPPDTTPPKTVKIEIAPPVPVAKRAQLEERAAEFELLDPRRDPVRYLALSTRFCAQSATEQDVRDSGTTRAGGFISDAELRRLNLLERGTRIVGMDITGYLLDTARVAVRLDGDPPRESCDTRIREWVIEGGDWHVRSCIP